LRYIPPVVRSDSRSRASWLGLAGLGLVAAVFAASSGGRSTQRADASTAEPAAANAPADIRTVDFGEVAPPGSACAEGLRFTPPAAIPVAQGRSSVLDIGRVTRLEVDPDVVYGDLDDDGDDEAVVHVVCTYGANGAEDTVHVWTQHRGRTVHVASLTEPPRSVSGALPPAVAAVAVAGSQVEVTWTRYAADDPNCCPTGLTTVTYELDGYNLDRVGRPVTRTAG
jgi:LppP/LprE lipoprotein